MKREVKIGIFAVVILVCAWAGIRFLSGLDVFSRSKVYYAHYNQVDGLQPASPVVIHGVKVGQVSSIELAPEHDKCVTVALAIDRKYSIPEDSYAKIYSGSLLGGKGIEIVLGTDSRMLSDSDDINTVEEENFLSTVGDSAGELIGRIEQVVASLDEALKSINELLAANEENITGIVSNLNSATGTLDNVLASRRGEISDLISNLDTFSKALSGNSERLGHIVMNVDSLASQFADADLAHNLQCTLERLNTLVDTAQNGDGTVSRLLTDDELYANLASASANLSSLLADLEAHPKRYVHFSLFGRSDKADKADKNGKTVKSASAAPAGEPAECE